MLLKRNFYNRNTVRVAKDLLGCFLVRKYRGKITRGIITETEVYRGEYDLASHASKGMTERNKIMYGEAGRAYVYLVYGMHYMFNIVTEERNFPAAVLVRGVRLVEAHCNTPLRLNGPGKLTKFFHIDKNLNGYDLTTGKKMWLEPPAQKISTKFIVAGKRVGVPYAGRCQEWKWNFMI